MSRRVGSALTEHIAGMRGRSKFIMIEGVPVALAEGMHAAWDDSNAQLPPLFVVSREPTRFGRRHLDEVSGSSPRNSSPQGLVLVVCEGAQVQDRNSVASFSSLSPGVLLETATGLGLLAKQPRAVPLDGPARAVREAINRLRPSERPSAFAVSDYLDAVAGGQDALAVLPILGGFTDRAGGVKVDGDRIADNLRLAAFRTSDDVLRPAAYAELRQRATAVLSRRAHLERNSAALATLVDDSMRQLQSGDPELLQTLQYDEAKEILEGRAKDLASLVVQEIQDYRRGLEPGEQAADLPWDAYIEDAEGLRRSTEQRQVAERLLDLDTAQLNNLFSRQTRVKLARLTRDKSINASQPSCPEYGFVRGIEQLGGPIVRVELIEPRVSGGERAGKSEAGRILSLAATRLRLGWLFRTWEARNADIDGSLLQPVDRDAPLEAFFDADLSTASALPTVRLRLHAEDRSSVQVDWKPDLDDLALLKATLVFAEAPCLSLESALDPSLQGFVANPPPAPVPCSAPMDQLARALHDTAREILELGLNPSLLEKWSRQWAATVEDHASADAGTAEALALAGCITGGDRSAALTGLAPMKAEWLAQQLQALSDLVDIAEEGGLEPVAATAKGVANATAAHYPGHLKLQARDRVLLPSGEGRIWSTFGTPPVGDEGGYAGVALTSVMKKLLWLQPEAAGHFKCLAWGPGAADLLVAQAVPLLGQSVGRGRVGKVEIFCVGSDPLERPSVTVLADADDRLRGQRDQLEIRYLDDLQHATAILGSHKGDVPSVHLALVTGITRSSAGLEIERPRVPAPAMDDEVLFAPRVWQRPGEDRRTLQIPPTCSEPGYAWLRLQMAVEGEWPERGDELRVPEIRTGALDLARELKQLHDLALWVATLDRYATRDSLELALGGADKVAILHQERRLGGDSPLSLVLSQKSGGPADRAIARSLQAAGIVKSPAAADDIGTRIRKVATQGYGILALQAATSGAGINELVGHVVAFSLLAQTTTPWPLPPGCRVLLVSLDEYQHWFPQKRADLLAIALDTDEGGVHVAAIEVKARRSDEADAQGGALDQLTQTLAATQPASQPEPGSLHSRLWLNRIAEAAYSVARESRFKLSGPELEALENFRRGYGTLEWAGVGLVFGPHLASVHKHYPLTVGADIVPVAMHSIVLTEELLLGATEVKVTDLRTVEAANRPLPQGGRVRRRPESKPNAEVETATTSRDALGDPEATEAHERTPATKSPSDVPEPATPNAKTKEGAEQGDAPAPTPVRVRTAVFEAPTLGWDVATGSPVRWHAAGPAQTLRNGTVEIWGSSGMGKTQFTMALLAQLAHRSGTRFGIADFKNDYSDETGFPRSTGASFIDLWNVGATFNPLARYDDTPKAIDRAVIEVRDTIEEAMRGFGRRQRASLVSALEDAYRVLDEEGRWPTMRTLHDRLNDDLEPILGDLTRHEIFRDGPPLADVVEQNVVFGLSKIPGNGNTTVLAAGLILSSVLLRIQDGPPVPNTLTYMCVVDEAHRVADFKAIDTMVREGRSKGLAVLLATQQPVDLPDIVGTVAQTKICFGLPDASMATSAARRLQPDNSRLPEQIRTLGVGEALVSLGGEGPVLVRMAQLWEHADLLQVPPLAK